MRGASILLRAAQAAGATFAVSGDRLQVSAPRPLPRDLVEELRREKKALIRLLAASDRPTVENDTPGAWFEFFHRRAVWWMSARHEPPAAARLAFGDCLTEWDRHHLRKHDPAICAGCGDPLGHDNALDLGRGTWVHLDRGFACLTCYGAAWRGAAVAGLRKVGVDPPEGFELL